MDKKTVQLSIPDHWLKGSDFMGITTQELLCEVTAVIWPRADGIQVQIERVHALGYRANLAGVLKHESEVRLCALMLTYYLNYARTGLEGDVPDLTA